MLGWVGIDKQGVSGSRHLRSAGFAASAGPHHVHTEPRHKGLADSERHRHPCSRIS